MNDEKEDNFSNDDIFNYLRKFKEEVSKENYKIERKFDSMEIKIDDKLKDMEQRYRRDIAENKKENIDRIDEIARKVERIEELFAKRTKRKKKTIEKKEERRLKK